MEIKTELFDRDPEVTQYCNHAIRGDKVNRDGHGYRIVSHTFLSEQWISVRFMPKLV